MAIVVCLVMLASLSAAAENHAGCVQTYDPRADYFPFKATVTDATSFTIEYVSGKL